MIQRELPVGMYVERMASDGFRGKIFGPDHQSICWLMYEEAIRTNRKSGMQHAGTAGYYKPSDNNFSDFHSFLTINLQVVKN